MIKAPKLGRGPRMKVAVERYTSRFPRGILVTITHCDPHEALEVMFYADRQQLNTMTVTAVSLSSNTMSQKLPWCEGNWHFVSMSSHN